MPMNQALLGEFDHEMANTRKTLERVPDGKWDWKPHTKSGTMGWMANHVAMFPGWAADMLTNRVLRYRAGRQAGGVANGAQPERAAGELRQERHGCAGGTRQG